MQNNKPVKRFLAVPLTNLEKIEFGHRLAQAHQEYRAVEVEKKHVADEYKDKLETLSGRVSQLAVIVRSGEEFRDVECKWHYIFETNVKELVRMDTGEIVETQPITAEERQLLLQIGSEKEAEQAAAQK